MDQYKQHIKSVRADMVTWHRRFASCHLMMDGHCASDLTIMYFSVFSEAHKSYLIDRGCRWPRQRLLDVATMIKKAEHKSVAWYISKW